MLYFQIGGANGGGAFTGTGAGTHTQNTDADSDSVIPAVVFLVSAKNGAGVNKKTNITLLL